MSLADFLPAHYVGSVATSIAFDGTRYFVGGYALNGVTGFDEAVLWVGVPAPATLGLLVGAELLAMHRRQRVSALMA